ncbi:MAG: NRDE family protein [Haloferacaceae archaeon]
MCTLILAWQVFPDAPVVVAANRDERRDRRADPPRRLEDDPAVVAPRDAEAGGTWIGYNERGLFVGVTNRWTGADLAGERSRGLLVRDVLRESGAEAAVRSVEDAVDRIEYQGFNLVVADATAAFLLEWDGRLRVRRFDPGVHVVVNVGASDAPAVPDHRSDRGEQQAHNARRVRAAAQPEPGEDADAWLDRAAGVLADHDYGVCIHADGYGTVSTSLIRLGVDGDRYDYADGPPCTTAFEPVEVGTD